MEKFYNIFERILTEEKEANYDYGCVMLSLDVDEKWWNTILDSIDKDDIYNGSKTDKDKYGLEKEPHVTILYGCLPIVTDKEIEDVLYSEPTPEVSITDISLFKNENYDVLKFDVDSKILHTLNGKLDELPNENEYPTYKPHMTICYLKSGVGDKVVNELKPLVNLPSKIPSKEYVYSKPNGGEIKFKLKNN